MLWQHLVPVSTVPVSTVPVSLVPISPGDAHTGMRRLGKRGDLLTYRDAGHATDFMEYRGATRLAPEITRIPV